MYLQIVETKKSRILNIVKSFRKEGGGTSSTIVEKLGNIEDIKKRENCSDPIAWAKSRVEELNKMEREKKQTVMLSLSPAALIPIDKPRVKCAGDLLLRKYYHRLGIDTICAGMAKRGKFQFNIDAIMQKLVYSRLLHRGSKLATYNGLGSYLDKSPFELEDVYRSLAVMSRESTYIQAGLYANSTKSVERDTSVVYYDCTNYFFEIEEADGFRKYGVSKEHRPNPIVQLGLFMDRDGLPLSFCINPGNTAETQTMTPLEDTMERDFGVSCFIVCTDAGLASAENRMANSKNGRGYITAASIKKMKEFMQEWALQQDEWRLITRKGDSEELRHRVFRLEEVKKEEWLDRVFYRERWTNEAGFDERVIVTYSYKYDLFAKKTRDRQLERAQKAIEKGGAKRGKSPNDPARFIKEEHVTQDGEVAQIKSMGIDADRVEYEEKYDGFYCLLTSLQEKDFHARHILAHNAYRYQVEALFRVTKTDLKARPVYLQVEERIKGHFITCVIALMILRLIQIDIDKLNKVEKRDGEKGKPEGHYSITEIRNTLEAMNLVQCKDGNFLPAYDRTQLTDCINTLQGYRTDTEVIPKSRIRKVLRGVKKG